MKQRIGDEIRVLSNLIRRRLCYSGEHLVIVTPMQGKIMHYLLEQEGKADCFQRDLEQRFAIRRSTATGILKLMEQRGLIRREAVAQDGRLKKLVLTEKARSCTTMIEQQIDELEEQMEKNLTPEELAAFFHAAEKISRNLQQAEDMK